MVGIRPGGALTAAIGDVPYLDGGLFEEDEDDRNPAIAAPDDCIAAILDELFDRFNFTVTESTPLDVEVAVDPEMLGRVFEELVTGRHETGSYYTPKPVVSFMCRQALRGYLSAELPAESPAAIEQFVEEHDPAGLADPEAALEALRRVKVVDPACGSGAYLLGALHELLDLRACLFATRRIDPLSVYQRKLEIIQRNLYGVDSDPFAVNIARLRLWLSLAVDFEGDRPPPLPNLDFKIETGDSLIAPDPSGGVATGFRYGRIGEFMQAKADYLMAHGQEKLALRRKIADLRDDIATWAGRPPALAGFDWAVEFAEVFSPDLTPGPSPATRDASSPLRRGESGGFDIVLANPPYVRADAQHRNIADEERRRQEIGRWQQYRAELKTSGIYRTLHEKWDLYVPFLERAYQLLTDGGQMVFIISDAYNAAKYARKSHEFFLAHSRIVRLDFCSEIPLFRAGVNNTILHFAKAVPDDYTPLRFRRWGDRPDDFDDHAVALPTAPQGRFGCALFRPDGQKPPSAAMGFVTLGQTCYVSVGIVVHADEKQALGLFKAEDVVSDKRDETHPKPYVEGKDILRWGYQRVRYLEYGTQRAPALFRRPTFLELHEAKERLLALRMCGEAPAVTYDDQRLFSNHTVIIFVPWHNLRGVVNKSISKTAKYRHQAPEGDRDEREALSQRFHPKYLLAIMNSAFARDWLARWRRSKTDIYPDDWKQLPIAPIPMEQQQVFVRLVDAILAEFAVHGYPLPAASAARVAGWEREIDERVAGLYGV